ncbi:hypothetical protein L1049_016254 [Liquidambar formosana]|uniref:DRBM domain-containing protein n=1 Tax=Liquidambar formosana TaxID=63359 RepID=A0AAP0X2U9_LIQFO
MYKNQLQELAQRSCFNLPSYACIREGPDHAPRFKATVNFNGETFESPTFCSTLRQAEHAAAEVALNVLAKNGPSKALAARVLDETGVYKNLLQETAHRAGLKLPVYTTVRSGPGHVPVFSCTVELAGMSFMGEPAKTKKQAQKNAAMAAWSSLKQMSRSGSSSSSSPSSESGGNDEQEQVIVARYLSSLQLPETNKFTQRDRQRERQGSAPFRRDVVPYDGGGSLCSMQRSSWAYSHFSPEVAAYQSWPQERASQQQSRLLVLPSAPTSPPCPQIFPFIRSIFQPDHGQYFLAREQEPIPFVPGIGPFLYFSNRSIPIPVRNISQVTIQEIEENPQVEDDWLHGGANSNCWSVNFPSTASGVSPIEAPNPPVALNSHPDLRFPEMLQEKDEEKNGRSASNTGNSNQLGTNRIEQPSWTSPRFQNSRFRPRATSTDDAKFQSQNPHRLDYLQHNSRPQNPHMASSPVLPTGFIPTPSAAPVTVRTGGAASLGGPRPESSRRPAAPPTRIAGSACSNRPWVEGLRNTGRLPPANFLAPAVHIRSVVPVCSAPPTKKMPGPSQDGQFSGAKRNTTENPEGEISAASSELGKLKI